MPPSKAKSKEQELLEAFKVFDTSGDGALDLSELKAIFQRPTGNALTDEQVQELFDEFDANGDGVLEFSEFSAFWTDSRERSGCHAQAPIERGATDTTRGPRERMVREPSPPGGSSPELSTPLRNALFGGLPGRKSSGLPLISCDSACVVRDSACA